jgi:hypothetical protein
MAFAWRSFLDIAEELADRDNEAAWRTAIGRAYYTVIGMAADALPPAERATVNPRNAHDRVWELYALSSVAPCRRLGNLGYTLRNRRRIADYNASQTVQAHHAQLAVADAQDLLRLLALYGYQP